MGSNVFDTDLNNIFMDVSPQARETKAKINYQNTKIKKFWTAKEIIHKTKRQPSQWEKIFANDTYYKGFIFKIYKELLQFNTIKNPIKNRCKT